MGTTAFLFNRMMQFVQRKKRGKKNNLELPLSSDILAPRGESRALFLQFWQAKN